MVRQKLVALCGVVLLLGLESGAQAAEANRPVTGGAAVSAEKFRMIAGAGGLPIAAMEWGNPDGPAILFLHGFSFAKEFWRLQNEPELSSRFHMVAIDLRGHGASGKPWAPAEYQDTRIWADDVAATLQAFGLRSPVIVGWSFGGFVAMDYLRHYGNNSVAGVMLVSSPAGLVDSLHPDTPGYSAAAAQQGSLDLSDNIRGERFFVRLMTAKPLAPAVEEEWLVETLRLPVYARNAMRNRPLGNKDLLPTLATPLMLVVGGEDRSMPVAALRGLTEGHPKISFTSMPAAGHAVAYETPDTFNRLLREFTERTQTSSPKH